MPQGAPGLRPQPIGLADLVDSLAEGRRTFAAARGLSLGYGAVFALIGLAILYAIETALVTPMALPAAGGFMLVGPALLAGFFRIAERLETGEVPTVADLADGFRRCPRGIWVIAVFCAFIFLVWITDAATLYAFMVGRMPAPLAALLPPPDSVWSFALWSSVMGSVLAFVIFAVSAYSVPLLFEGRADLIPAVAASVRAVFASPVAAIAWALSLAVGIMGAILLLPLFPVVFPVLAFASRALYRRVFPAGEWQG